MTSTPPANTLRDGNLKATIWQNEGNKGAYYSTTFSRIYKDDQGEYRETQSFSSNDLLRISELARQAHNQTNEFNEITHNSAIQTKHRIKWSSGLGTTARPGPNLAIRDENGNSGKSFVLD